MRVGRNGDRKENEKMASLAFLRKLITNAQFNILIPSTEGSALDRYWLAAWRYARGSNRNDLKDDLGIRGWWQKNTAAVFQLSYTAQNTGIGLQKGGKLSLHKFSNFPGCKSKRGFQEAERVK